MKPVYSVSLLATLLLSAACGTLSAQPDVPALIARPTANSRAELIRVVTSAANGAPVTLADDALTQESSLVIERREPRDLQGRALAGRVLDMPQQFRLVLRDARCVLVRLADGQRWELTETLCVPNPDPSGR